MGNKQSKRSAFTGVFAALAASSCCIPPFISAVAGVGGMSSSLIWMEPLRPYLITLAIISIGYAWFTHFKTKSKDDCGCNIQASKWYQTKTFLISMTFFAVISISLPYFSYIFFEPINSGIEIESSENIIHKTVIIEGMTCEACQNHVNFEISKLNGVLKVNTSYSNSNTVIEFDSTLTNLKEINSAILITGYKPKQ